MKKAFCLLSFFAGCMGLGTAQQVAGWFERQVKCKADSSQTYTAYIPSGYSPGSLTALLIFLDPAARGGVPVRQYVSLAEEHHIIMAGSGNSRNFDGQSSVDAFVAVYNDIVSRFTIDPARVWLAGFSGGARAATLIAANYPVVTGVIGCGAGFPGEMELSPGTMKAYAGLVGDRDMNFVEMMENSRYLSEKQIPNLLISFSGEHVWPPVQHTGVVIEWLMEKAGYGSLTCSPGATRILETTRRKADSGYLYTAWQVAEQLKGLAGCREQASAMASSVSADKKFNDDKKLFEKAAEEELNHMNAFSLRFGKILAGETLEPGDQWKGLAKKIHDMQDDPHPYRQMAGTRCRDHCIRSSREYYFRFMGEREYEKATHAAEVAIIFSHKDPTGYYFLARAQAGMKMKKEARENLSEAARLGLGYGAVEKDLLLNNILSMDELRGIFQ